jgi:anti-anti-sigma regulatory factor
VALFSKPPAKKPDPKTDSRRVTGPRPVSAREVAAQAAGRQKPPAEPPAHEPSADLSVTGASLLEWSTAPSAIEVAQANPGLCTVLENAALMYASGQAPAARKLLDDGIANDEDTKLSPLAWLALFDLLQRANDHAAFDQLALQYVVQFERSAPAWEERAAPAAARTMLSKPTAGGYVAVTGNLSAGAVASPLEGLRRAVDKHVEKARVDFSQVTGFDDAGARDLADLLARARKLKVALSLQRPEKLRAAVEAAVAKGKEGGEGAWLLSMELMQWLHEQAAFDDRAVEFAIAFELSPPSWEPPPEAAGTETPPVAPDEAQASHAAPRDVQTLEWSGVMTGQSARQLLTLGDFAATRSHLSVDMTELERIDFVCAGALLNTINRIESQRKSVQIVGASPIIRALLLLIGISPRHFVRKTP